MPVSEPGSRTADVLRLRASGAEGSSGDRHARFSDQQQRVHVVQKTGGFDPLPRPNIDYGGGLERIMAAVNGDPDIYRTVFFTRAMRRLEGLTGKTYAGNEREFRIVLDHARAATFLINDGAAPSNVDAGYITRRLMRRAMRVGRKLGLMEPFLAKIAEIYIAEATAYPDLALNRPRILQTMTGEEEQFARTLATGEREMKRHLEQKGDVTGADAFYFYETYGFPRELTEEFLSEFGTTMLDPDGFAKAAKEHAERSRTAAAGKFKGGLADHSELTTALHTATHLMLAGLQEVLGGHVHQKGSNITAERARFDFSHDAKMTDEQKAAVEVGEQAMRRMPG
jgi:alanyl-tRNA synthetase